MKKMNSTLAKTSTSRAALRSQDDDARYIYAEV